MLVDRRPYILSKDNPRHKVEGEILMTLTVCLKADGLRKLDFSDGRLGIMVDQADQNMRLKESVCG